ncbi:TrmH family RNA methyltransferase [Blattabacterium cuenoti]|uniref:TrmH family RNA methyltransferase n=1 Tax=Blattabacterium cuenoti TaxID=1653831 RepID=UPI00163B6667|nr:RNA methyltransferase [Blattabacterium cuenoti]
MKKINSIQNTKIKYLKKVYGKKKLGFFIVEGLHEFQIAIKNQFIPTKIFICKDIFYQDDIVQNYQSIIYFISIKIFNKLVYRKNSGGIIALFREKKIHDNLINMKLVRNSLILILDGIEKPGNLGSMLRTATAAGFCMIILHNMKTYIFNPNVIRCSIGTVFNNRFIIENNIKKILSWIRKNRVEIVATGFHKKSINLYENNFRNLFSIAIVFGSEHQGLSKIWYKIADKIIKIPMFGNIDSLNVSNAMSIIVYEIIRQKKFLLL